MRIKSILLICILTVLAGTATAQAMTPRIDKTLKLTTAGAVQAHGPFGAWDADEASAVVKVTFTQGGKSESGTSRRYQHGAASWAAVAGSGDPLSPGSAVGHATAFVKLTNGTTETYSWTVAVTLVH